MINHPKDFIIKEKNNLTENESMLLKIDKTYNEVKNESINEFFNIVSLSFGIYIILK